MTKTRRNINLENENYDLINDVQYVYRKSNKKKVSLSEIVNTVLRSNTVKTIVKLLESQGRGEKG